MCLSSTARLLSVEAFFGYLFHNAKHPTIEAENPCIIPAAQGGTKAPSRPAPNLGTSSVVVVVVVMVLVVVDLGRGWPVAELAAQGASWVLKQQLCPGKLRCSVRQTQEYVFHTTESHVKGFKL